MSHHGTLGHDARKTADFQYALDAPARSSCIHSDGLVTRWTLEAYPGLAEPAPRAHRRGAVPGSQRDSGRRDCSSWLRGRRVSPRFSTLAIHYERDVVLARQRARQLAAALGFDAQDQTRIATAVSEIARNAFRYARGGSDRVPPRGQHARRRSCSIASTDDGPGIPNLPTILDGRYRSATGMGVGIIGARRLMDRFTSSRRRARARASSCKKSLPRARRRCSAPSGIGELAQRSRARRRHDPLDEVQQQNQELLRALDELARRQDELHGPQPRARGHQPRRRRAVRRAGREGRAPAPRRRDEVAVPLQHEPRVPHAGELDPGAGAAPARPQRRRAHRASRSARCVFIRQAADALSELVDDLLDLAKIEAGQDRRAAGRVRGRRPLRRAPRHAAAAAGQRSVQLVFDEPDDAARRSTPTKAKVSQILRNFISNALKFTERGEVRVAATLSADGSGVVFRVADTGIGIAPEDQERIFQEFTQIESPVQRRVQGTGLGLPLCRKLAELLGGSVCGGERARASASTFTATIPSLYASQVPDEPELAARAEPRCPCWSSRTARRRSSSTSACWPASAFQVLPARSVREAHLALAAFRPRAIVLDILAARRGGLGFPRRGEAPRRHAGRPRAGGQHRRGRRQGAGARRRRVLREADRAPALLHELLRADRSAERQAHADRRRRGDLPLRAAPASGDAAPRRSSRRRTATRRCGSRGRASRRHLPRPR